MDTIQFSALPFIVKFTSLLTFFLAWVAFAEFIIDRHGLDKFLPLYRVGIVCPYDIAVVALLAFVWFHLHR